MNRRYGLKLEFFVLEVAEESKHFQYDTDWNLK
jgi:hypothetical protein